MNPHGRPPPSALRFLRMVVPRGVVGDSIVGDAHEEFVWYVRAGGRWPTAWFWLHTIRVAGGYIMTRGREVEMGTLWRDLKFGARSLGKMPGSAAVAVVVLAIGIGLSAFMFSLIYGVYFRGMDVPEADRIFVVYETNLEADQSQRNVPIQNFMDWRERQTSFEGLVGTYSGTVNVSDGGAEPQRFQGAFVTADAFPMLRTEPILGRAFASGEDRPGSPPHLLIGYDVWMSRYGGARDIVGTEVRVNGEPATVLGVMPDGFQWPYNTEVWVPMREDPYAAARGQGQYLSVHGRLKDGVSRDQASLEMASIAQALESEYPEVNEGIGTRLSTVVEANTGDEINLVFGGMLFAVICVLLVACANVASLLLARASLRTKEAGVRIAMGGSRFRVMLPFLSEALVLSLVGAVVGIGITFVATGWFDEVTNPARVGRPWFMQFEVDLPILAFVIGVSVLSAILAGIAPAFQMSRTDVNSILKDESRGSSSMSVGRLTRVLVTAEVALSVALLVGAGLMTKSIVRLGDAEYPFATEELFTARVGLFAADYPEEEDRLQFWDDLVSELEALPQLAAVGLTDVLPYNGGSGRRVAIDGQQYEEDAQLPQINRAVITPGYIGAMGQELLSGRNFTVSDDGDSELVAIVNQPMVERYFGGSDPIGRQFREGASDTLPVLTVVGVAPDLHMGGPELNGEEFEPAGYYVPLRQHDRAFLSVAGLTRSGSALSVTGDVRAAVRRLDSDLPIYDVRSEAEVIDQQLWFFKVFGVVFISFGLAALFMASVGLYGVLSFAVSRRTQEMGIRMALGAASRDVVRLVARQGASQLGLGLAIGLALAFGVTRIVALLMYQVDPQDPTVFAAVLSLIVVVGVAAAVFPARRATSVDPVEALRAE